MRWEVQTPVPPRENKPNEVNRQKKTPDQVIQEPLVTPKSIFFTMGKKVKSQRFRNGWKNNEEMSLVGEEGSLVSWWSSESGDRIEETERYEGREKQQVEKGEEKKK
jgi:hypothetical protein